MLLEIKIKKLWKKLKNFDSYLLVKTNFVKNHKTKQNKIINTNRQPENGSWAASIAKNNYNKFEESLYTGEVWYNINK